MSKPMMKIISGSILFLACMGNAAKITVNDRPGEGDYSTIQDAVDAASSGDSIVINPNSDSRGYREQVIVSTPNLTITGSRSGKERARFLRATTTTNDESSKKINTKQAGERALQKKGDKKKKKKSGGKGGGKGGDSFPFDALDKRGFPSLHKQPDCPDVFLDGCDEDRSSCDNTVFTIRAPGVTIENIFLRHGDIEFASGSDGGKFIKNCVLGDDMSAEIATSGTPNSITISNNFFQGGDGNSVDLDGDSHEISSNLVVPCDNGFKIDGNEGLITNNKFFGCNDNAIEYIGDRGIITNNEIYHGDFTIDYVGDDGVIIGNTIIGVYEGIKYNGDNGRIAENDISSTEKNGISYGGDNGTITDNEVTFASDYGIDYDGDNPTITHNIVEFIQDIGIDLSCEGRSRFLPCIGGTISYNDVIGGADDFEAIGINNVKNLLVEYNTISYASESGLEFFGDGSTIRGNLIARCGTDNDIFEHAMEIRGDDNIIEDNELKFNTFDAINQDRGNNNVYRRNTINGNGRAGIRVERGTGTVISENTIIDNHGEGIAIEGGSNTAVRDNELSNNRIDICNGQSDTSPTGNSFTTGGFSTNCEAGLS